MPTKSPKTNTKIVRDGRLTIRMSKPEQELLEDVRAQLSGRFDTPSKADTVVEALKIAHEKLSVKTSE